MKDITRLTESGAGRDLERLEQVNAALVEALHALFLQSGTVYSGTKKKAAMEKAEEALKQAGVKTEGGA